MVQILLGVEAMGVEVEVRGSQAVKAGMAENIVEADLKVGSVGIVEAAVAAELGLDTFDVWPQTAELVKESRDHEAKMGQKAFGAEVIEQVDFVVVEAVEEHLEQVKQESWLVVEGQHVDVTVGWNAGVGFLL